MRDAFAVHMLNVEGKKKAAEIAAAFDRCLGEVEKACESSGGRYMAVVTTKMEEACFFAKKAMATQPQNQVVRDGNA